MAGLGKAAALEVPLCVVARSWGGAAASGSLRPPCDVMLKIIDNRIFELVKAGVNYVMLGNDLGTFQRGAAHLPHARVIELGFVPGYQIL